MGWFIPRASRDPTKIFLGTYPVTECITKIRSVLKFENITDAAAAVKRERESER